MENYIFKVIQSWSNSEGNVNTQSEIIEWISELNKKTIVNINECDLEDTSWQYNQEEHCIDNEKKAFFEVKGLVQKSPNKKDIKQPIIIQNEIGYLGIICKEIGGVLNLLMQAKIEPGNINKIQLSPTIQATKSNFTQKHGGRTPNYLNYFLNADQYTIIVDQIQSEQSSRFYKKRNRNTIIVVDDEVEVLPNYKWMTLGQIKKLMELDNIVNMDTRTVLSCIPFTFESVSKDKLQNIRSFFKDKALFNSIFNNQDDGTFVSIYKYINDYKMFNESEVKLVGLNELDTWTVDSRGIRCKTPYSFSVIYCDIEVEGREVTKWTQPLFKSEGLATFGLMTTVEHGIRKFLVKCRGEVGCFDRMELGPTIQKEAVDEENVVDEVSKVFDRHLEERDGLLYNVILSEEGGRFYHEQNHNIIVEVNKDEIVILPKGYFWADYKTLNRLVQINNCLNIQLRNLLSLLEV